MPYANMELFTDLPHFIHNQRSVLFVAHKAITDRTSKISSCPFKGTKSQQRGKVSKGAKIRNRYNQEPHLTQDTNGKVTNSLLDTTNESQEVSPFPAGDHKANINRLT